MSTFTTIEDKTPKSPINSVEPPPISPPISVKRKPVASNTIQEESSGVHVHEFRLLSEIRREVYAGGADKDDKKISKDDGKKKKDTEGKKSQHRRRNCDGSKYMINKYTNNILLSNKYRKFGTFFVFSQITFKYVLYDKV